MRILKILFVFLIIVVALLLIVAAFVPKNYEVERTVTIDAKPCQVFPEAQYFQNFVKWDPWSRQDTAIKQTFEGEPGAAGSKYSWESEKVGSGYMERITNTKDKAITNKIVFTAPQSGVSDGFMRFDEGADENQTVVTWGFSGETGYPWNIMNLFLDGMVGKDFETGLANLKEIVESKEAITGVDEVEIYGSTYHVVRKEIGWDEMKAFYPEAFGKAYGHMEQNCIEPAGPAVGVYYVWDVENQRTDVAAGFPSNIANDTATVMDTLDMNGSTMMVYSNRVVYTHVGDYEKTGEAHEAIESYFENKDVEIQTPVMEVYRIGPDLNPDPSKWETDIVYYYK
jgi:effector-binding domain-containing protein